jgi:pilus assembly protein CpaB
LRLRDIIGLVIALLLAIGVAFLTRLFLTEKVPQPQSVTLKEVQTTQILVAGQALDQGDKIKAGDLIWQEWPKISVNPNYLSVTTAKPEDYIGAIVVDHLDKGEPVTLTDFVKQGEKGTLAAILTPGKRAISIDVSPAATSSGLITPGDFVDVVLSQATASAEGSQQQITSQTLLKNIKVLATDASLSSQEGKTLSVPRVVTLEVTPQQAEILLSGSKEGTLSLSLHGLETEKGVTEVTEPAIAEKKQGEALNKTLNKTQVTIMRGANKSTVEFNEDSN